jgi:hypothetical protein
MGAIMQIFDKNRFLFGFTLSCILGMPPTAIAETHLPDSDEKKPIIIQLERLPEIAARESDRLKSLRSRQRESRKNRAKLKNAILLERINSQKMGWAIKRRDVRGIEGIKNVITIAPKNNWLIIQLGEEIIVINPNKPQRLPQILTQKQVLPQKAEHHRGIRIIAPQNPGVHIPADDLDYAPQNPGVHIPAGDLD